MSSGMTICGMNLTKSSIAWQSSEYFDVQSQNSILLSVRMKNEKESYRKSVSEFRSCQRDTLFDADLHRCGVDNIIYRTAVACIEQQDVRLSVSGELNIERIAVSGLFKDEIYHDLHSTQFINKFQYIF